MRLFLIYFFISSTIIAQKTDPNFTKGLKAYNSNNPDKAVAYFEKVINKDPKNALAYLYIAKAKEESFSGGSTLDYLNKAIELDSTLVEAYHYRSISFEVDDIQANLRDVSKAISLDPSNYGYYYNRAGILLELEEYEGAIADAKKCFELEQEGAVSFMYSIIARGYAGLEKYDVALIFANKYITAEADVDGYNTRGDVYFKMGDFKLAMEDYTKFATETEQDVEIYGGYIYKKIGETHLKLGDKTAACESFQKAIDRSVVIDSILLNQCK